VAQRISSERKDSWGCASYSTGQTTGRPKKSEDSGSHADSSSIRPSARLLKIRRGEAVEKDMGYA
jgi:hypothetical protein